MAENYLIDTSAVVKYLNETLSPGGLIFIDKIVDSACCISFITEIELLVWEPPDPNDLEVYHSFVSNSLVVGINDNIVRETIRIRKAYKLKLPDAIIAATAISQDMKLIADNDKDFKRVPELNHINPQQFNQE